MYCYALCYIFCSVPRKYNIPLIIFALLHERADKIWINNNASPRLHVSVISNFEWGIMRMANGLQKAGNSGKYCVFEYGINEYQRPEFRK